MNTVKERLLEFIKSKKMTIVEFERSIGVSNGYVSSISKSIQPDKLEVISDNNPELSIEWLLIGKGSMFKSEQPLSIMERLKYFIKEQSIAETEFCESIDMPYVFYTQMKGAIPERHLKNIITKYPQLNIAWLMAGEGSMLKSEQPEIADQDSLINYGRKGTPYYNVDFIGGFDLVVNDQTTIPDYYIDYPPYNKPDVIWCNVTGHSMEPEIHHGDTMAIKKLNETNINYLPFGEVYAIVTDDYRTVKRISKADKEGFIKLVPSNKSPEYTPQDIPLTMIRAIYQVLVSVKRF